MNVCLTGSTGFIGLHLGRRLAEQGHLVHALYRSEEKRAALSHPNIRPFLGDILTPSTLSAALHGCQRLYHAAALTEVRVNDEAQSRRFNVEGSKNVLEAALRAGVTDVVITSTAGVMGPSLDGRAVNETTVRQSPYFLAYEKTKAEAEDVALSYAHRGLRICIVNPTRVYGPCLPGSHTPLTSLIESYVRGAWRVLPDGRRVGNYVYVDDVVEGHLLAMEKGRNGQRYILGGENCSYAQFFETLAKTSGVSRILFPAPLRLAQAVSYVVERMAIAVGVRPPITPAIVKRYTLDWIVSSEKAIRELGYKITSLEEGLEKTIRPPREQK